VRNIDPKLSRSQLETDPTASPQPEPSKPELDKKKPLINSWIKKG